MSDKNIKTPNKCIRLSIELGTELQIEIKRTAARFKSELIGMEPNRYLIIKLPHIIDASFEEKCIRSKGVDIIARYLYRGTVYGFRSPLIDIILSPAKLMFIEYPHTIEEYNIRKNERIDCIIPCKIKFESYILDATITNISVSGCQIAITSHKTDADVLVMSLGRSDKINVMFRLPGETKDLLVPVIRKNTRKDEFKISVGAEFYKIDKKTGDDINQFILTAKKTYSSMR